MKSVFDTMAYVSWHTLGKLPEKWKHSWDTCAYKGDMLVTEPLISEIYTQVARKDGSDSARNCILKIKGLKGTKMFPTEEDDNLAMEAGKLRLLAERQKRDISFVDSYLLAVCKRTGARLHTTDHGIRDFARVAGCQVNWLPLEELGS